MAKRFKLKLSLSTFQFCRSNPTSSLPKSPLSSTLFSPINPKSLEISFPSFPDPPPTPNCPSKIMPDSFNIECNLSTCDTQKMYNSPVSVSFDSDDSTAWPITPPKGHKKKNRRKNSKRRSISSADSGWFSSDQEDIEIDEESESLMSSSENFDSSCDFGIPINNNTRKKKNSSSVKVRRLMRRYVSNSWKSGGGGGEEIPVRKSSVFRRMMMSCAVEGKVKESFAVVKNSENPYEDFKGSMMEMILEKQMFEAKDLEQLLQCFLSLNSRHHHAAIVQAFSEIWESSFLGRMSNHSLPSSNKQKSSMVRSFIFGRDDSNSRSLVSISEDSSDAVSRENRPTRNVTAKFSGSITSKIHDSKYKDCC